MLQFRQSFFETNSSSTHAFIVDLTTRRAKTSVRINPNFDLDWFTWFKGDEPDFGPSFLYAEAKDARQEKEFFNYLYRLGIDTIYLGTNELTLKEDTSVDDPTFEPLDIIQHLIFSEVEPYCCDTSHEQKELQEYIDNPDRYFIGIVDRNS